ncbi:FACT complex subunit pob3 [Cryoendolithus antarcticus]|uniref:FACT complex subunit POB3 n=1 Tax=Cryoendolithus antarcticus TaxID=1507870 RepID=A0A1V8TBC8_9PEZI|nr:FACT complex subunit pob3 [Cryoendolithus antarcticus]
MQSPPLSRPNPPFTAAAQAVQLIAGLPSAFVPRDVDPLSSSSSSPLRQRRHQLGSTASRAVESFDNIYLDLSKEPGKCRLAESGLGWKPAGGTTFTLDKAELAHAQWSKAAKGYELRLHTKASDGKNGGVVQLDGFKQDDHDTIAKCFKVWYGVEFVQKEHALRGWNWGKTEVGKNELMFNVRNQPAFELPYSEISNTNLPGKNELAIEFALQNDDKDTGTNGHLGGARGQGKKSSAALDQLTEIRFYIPGQETRKAGKASDDEGSGNEEEEEDVAAAMALYDTLVAKAQIGEVAGETFATFLEVLHLTPRGRFDIDIYKSSFRLRGKTYDYKIEFEKAKRFFLLQKPDDLHTLLCIGMDPPLRQGQTRYPFLVMQFKRDEETQIELNITDETLKEYGDRLQPAYEGPIANVIAKIFHGLTGKRLLQPSKDLVTHHNQSGVKCSIKASEGHLYCLDRAFLFVPKPATYLSFDNIASVTMSRVGGAVSASRTFDLLVLLRNGAGEHQFSNINREEQQPLENFFAAKNIKVKNEMDVDGGMLAAALSADPDLASSEDEEVVQKDRGSADEDSESEDEDFQADSDSDVAEEFDENAASSGSDAEMADAGGSDSDTAEKVERPKKKSKTK